jgi:drug/metabolite transporter (DMT)-like permease
MSTLGIVHGLIGLAALFLSFGIFLRRKGDRLHKWLGWVFVPLMFVTLTIAVYLGLIRSFHAFNAYALVALAALVGAVLASRFRTRVPDWRFWHAGFMSFTVLSALAALSGVIVGIAIEDGNGPPFYRAFNAAIVTLTIVALWFMVPRLTPLCHPNSARRSLWTYKGLVAVVTGGVVLVQAFYQT